MKVIFLDFDGVLNSKKWFIERAPLMERGGLEYPKSEFDPEAIDLLNYIIQQTGALVVVSSTWRLSKTTDQLQELLNSVGFNGRVVDKTPSRLSYNKSIRGKEIKTWINVINLCDSQYSENRIERYAIVDDDRDMLESQLPFFVKTTFAEGLTKELADKIIQILNKE